MKIYIVDTMKTRHLNVHRKWFDMIRSGEKKEEYREIKPYWEKRLVYTRPFGTYKYKEFSSVTFSNGYGKDRDRVEVEFKGIGWGWGRLEWGAEWGKTYFVIYLGEIIEDEM